MEDGYYWYFPAEHEDLADLADVQIVDVFDGGRRVAICGGSSYDVADAKGCFVGPIRQPEKP